MLNIIYKIAYSWFHLIRTELTNECIRWYLLSMILLLLLRALVQLWLICALSLASSQNLSYLDIYQELFVTHFIWYIHCSYQKARTDSERFIFGGKSNLSKVCGHCDYIDSVKLNKHQFKRYVVDFIKIAWVRHVYL